MNDEPFRFGRLTVVRITGRDKHGNRILDCRCDCGTVKAVIEASLISGNTRSCGCLQREAARRNGLTQKHGMCRSPEYKSYQKMLERCYSEADISYPNYGGRGITVCERWLGEHGFENFLADVGRRPARGHSIDRHPNINGNYEPGNVRWATRKEQNRNTRRNRYFIINGKRSSLADLCDDSGISRDVVYQRVRKLGWDIERALATPIQEQRRA